MSLSLLLSKVGMTVGSWGLTEAVRGALGRGWQSQLPLLIAFMGLGAGGPARVRVEKARSWNQGDEGGGWLCHQPAV